MALARFGDRKVLALAGLVGGVLLVALLVFFRETPAYKEVGLSTAEPNGY